MNERKDNLCWYCDHDYQIDTCHTRRGDFGKIDVQCPRCGTWQTGPTTARDRLNSEWPKT